MNKILEKELKDVGFRFIQIYAGEEIWGKGNQRYLISREEDGLLRINHSYLLKK